jgi:hypothetical protein
VTEHGLGLVTSSLIALSASNAWVSHAISIRFQKLYHITISIVVYMTMLDDFLPFEIGESG